MVYHSKSPDPDDSSLFRLRNSVIGPWIASSPDSQESVPNQGISISRSDLPNSSLRNSEQEEVMLEVGNLNLIDQDDINAHTSMYRTVSGSDDAIIEQSSMQTIQQDDSSLELTTEPQNISVIYLGQNDSAQESQDLHDVITIRDYNRVLELSHPFEFTIPSAIEQQEYENSNLENFINDFESSLNRIEDLQREINEIRELYNDLLNEDVEEVGQETIIYDSNLEETSGYNQVLLELDVLEEESVLSPLVGEESRSDDIGSFSQFFQQLSRADEEEEDDERLDLVEELEDDEESLVSASWRFQNGDFARQQFTQQSRHNVMRRNNLLPNFYLDSNGIPSIELERQLNFSSRRIFTNDSSSKSAPFCRMDSNGDIECIIAFYASNSRGELNVEVYDKLQKKEDTLLFKEIRNDWRNDHGECIGR